MSIHLFNVSFKNTEEKYFTLSVSHFNNFSILCYGLYDDLIPNLDIDREIGGNLPYSAVNKTNKSIRKEIEHLLKLRGFIIINNLKV